MHGSHPRRRTLADSIRSTLGAGAPSDVEVAGSRNLAALASIARTAGGGGAQGAGGRAASPAPDAAPASTGDESLPTPAPSRLIPSASLTVRTPKNEAPILVFVSEERGQGPARFRQWEARLSAMLGIDIRKLADMAANTTIPVLHLGGDDGFTSCGVHASDRFLHVALLRGVTRGDDAPGSAVTGPIVASERIQVGMYLERAAKGGPSTVSIAVVVSRIPCPGVGLLRPRLDGWLTSAVQPGAPEWDDALKRGYSILTRAQALAIAATDATVLGRAEQIVARRAAGQSYRPGGEGTGPKGSEPPAAAQHQTDTHAAGQSAGEDLRAMLSASEATSKHLASELDAARREIFALRSRVSLMSQQPVVEMPDDVDPSDRLRSWGDVWRFVDEHLQGLLIVTAKAIDAATGSDYTNFTHAARVLRLLAVDYRDMKLGLSGARERFEAACRRNHVSVSPTGKSLDIARFKESYTVAHRGVSYSLDLHVRGSSSRDRRRGFRCYFHWDDALRCAIIGSMPDHLDSTHT